MRRRTPYPKTPTALEELQHERETGAKYRRLECARLAASVNPQFKSTADVIFDAQRLFEFVEDGALRS